MAEKLAERLLVALWFSKVKGLYYGHVNFSTYYIVTSAVTELWHTCWHDDYIKVQYICGELLALHNCGLSEEYYLMESSKCNARLLHFTAFIILYGNYTYLMSSVCHVAYQSQGSSSGVALEYMSSATILWMCGTHIGSFAILYFIWEFENLWMLSVTL